MGFFSGKSFEEPLHYGEVFGMWSYLNSLKGTITSCQVFMNHVGDADLFKFLEDMAHEAQREEMEIEQVLKENGVSLPPSPADKAYSDLEHIPVGARFTDQEISATTGTALATGMVACSQIMGQSTHEDVAMMFGQYHSTKAQASARLLRMNKEKGWLVKPPVHDHIPQAVTV